MLVYYVVGLSAFACTYLNVRLHATKRRSISPDDQKTNDGSWEGKELPLVALCILFVTFAGIRYGVGSDYFLYTSLYDAINPKSLTESLILVPQEFGWVSLSWVLRNFTTSTYPLFFIASLLTIFPTMLAIKRKSRDPALAVFIFFFLGYYSVTFNAVRQSISVAFLLLAETYRIENRFKWVLCSAVAVIFHSSALVAIAVQLIAALWRPTWKSVALILFASAFGAYAVLNSGVVTTIAVALNPRYETYLNNEGAGLGTWMVLCVRILFIIMILVRPVSKENAVYLAYVCVSAAILVMGSVNQVFVRFEPYFGIFLILLVPNILIQNKDSKLLRFLLILGSLVYFGFHIYSFNAVIPYTLNPEIF